MAIGLGANIQSVRSLRRLDDTTHALAATFERLSSGQRINRASDDAAGLAVASRLEVHSRIATQGLQNISYGLSFLSIADQALQGLSDILTRQTELAEQSANGIFSSAQRQALNTEAQALRAEYNRIVATTAFNNVGLFSQSNPNIFIQTGIGDENAFGIEILREVNEIEDVLSIQSMLPPGYSNNDFSGARFFVYDTGDVGNVLIAISFASNSSGDLELLVQSYGANDDGEFSLIASLALDAGGPAAGFDTALFRAQISGSTLRIDYDAHSGTPTFPVPRAEMLITPLGAFGAPSLTTAFMGLADQSLSSVSANFTGLRGNETVEAISGSAGFEAVLSEFVQFQDIRQRSFSLLTETSSRQALDFLAASLVEVGEVRSRLGASESRLNTISEVVRVARDQMLGAASRITDADIAAETASLVRLSILQQAGVAVLASANVQPQLALDLLTLGA